MTGLFREGHRLVELIQPRAGWGLRGGYMTSCDGRPSPGQGLEIDDPLPR